MADRAQRLYDFSSQQTGCATPVVVFNELAGARPRDAVVGHERAVPRERALAHPAHRRARCASGAADPGRDLCGRRRARVVAAGRGRRRDRARDLRAGDGDVEAGRRCSATGRCATATAPRSTDLTSIGIPANKVGLMVSFATTVGLRRPQRARAHVRVVPGGEVAGARGAAGRGRDRDRVGLVVGVGEMERRRAGSREGARGVRLALGAVTVALRRADAARPAASTRRSRTAS